MKKFRFSHSAIQIAVVSLMLGLTLPITVFAQCDECIDKPIIIYDFDFGFPAPPDTATQQVLIWKKLLDLSKLVRQYSRQTDPSQGCFTWTDGGMCYANAIGDSTYDPDSYNSAPEGPIREAAYILAGFVTSTGSPGLFSLTWQIECGTSREVVLSTNYNFSIDSSWSYLDIIAQLATAGLQPIHQIIQDFEIKKRNEDVGIARSSGSILMTPMKTELQANDSTEIEMELFDECDGTILKNREIILEDYYDPWSGEYLCHRSTGGTVHPTRVTTDENGKAKVTFVAGPDGGLGIIEAIYPFKKPHGWDNAKIVQEAINIESSMWKVDITYSYSGSSSTDATTMEGENTTRSTASSSFNVSAKLHFVYENIDPNNNTPDKLIVTTDDPTAGIVHGLNYSGNYQENGTSRIEKWDGDGNSFAKYFSQTFLSSQGQRTLIDPGLYFYFYEDGIPYFQMSGTIRRIGWSGVKISGFPTTEPVKFDELFSAVNVMFSMMEDGASINHDESGYHANYTKSVTTNEPGTSSTYRIAVKANFRGKIPSVDVKDNPPSSLPENFALFQNYPNPFNPTTTIQFDISKASFVTLKVYNVLGQEVATLVNEDKKIGKYEVEFSAEGGSASGGNASTLSSGVYFYRLVAGDYVSTKKFILIK